MRPTLAAQASIAVPSNRRDAPPMAFFSGWVFMARLHFGRFARWRAHSSRRQGRDLARCQLRSASQPGALQAARTPTEQARLNDEKDTAAGGIHGQHVERGLGAGGLDDIDKADQKREA